MISIILRTYWRLEYTKQCIEAILSNTDWDFELIIVDNNSKSIDYDNGETARYLATLNHPNIHIHLLNTNLWDWMWFLYWCDLAKGDYMVQLDNDIIVPKRWDFYLKCLLKYTDCQISMLKRNHTAFELVVDREMEFVPCDELCSIKRWYVEKGVWCYMFGRKFYETNKQELKTFRGWKSKLQMALLASKKVGKVLNYPCKVLDSISCPIYKEYPNWKVVKIRWASADFSNEIPCLQKYPRKNWEFI